VGLFSSLQMTLLSCELMDIIYFIFIGFIAFALIVLLLKNMSHKSKPSKYHYGLLYIVSGMLIGLCIGVSIFFSIDKTKGWNPYGYWFLATFGATIAGGLIGVLFFGCRSKKE